MTGEKRATEEEDEVSREFKPSLENEIGVLSRYLMRCVSAKFQPRKGIIQAACRDPHSFFLLLDCLRTTRLGDADEPVQENRTEDAIGPET